MTKEGFKLSKKCECGKRLWARKSAIICDGCKTSKPSPTKARRRENGQLP